MKRTLVVISSRGRVLRGSRRTGALTVWSAPERRWMPAGRWSRWFRGSVSARWAPP
ncbi:MAG TPA: hypothetical protein VNI01_14195 [Elusimicrobiota bacterium]|nr:hypothetical protein [Elusimicrobiota bacterium]